AALRGGPWSTRRAGRWWTYPRTSLSQIRTCGSLSKKVQGRGKRSGSENQGSGAPGGRGAKVEAEQSDEEIWRWTRGVTKIQRTKPDKRRSRDKTVEEAGGRDGVPEREQTCGEES